MTESTTLDRHLRFPGTINFRDMGGYRTVDGNRVKMGRLFRSGHLAHTEPDARAAIAELGIGLVCDFRTDAERNEHPNQYAVDHTPIVKHLPIWPQKTPGSDIAAQKMLHGEIGTHEAGRYLGSGYREFARHQHERFAEVFSSVVKQGGSSALLHCSAGKDRTGIAAALLLHTLGVSRDDIVSDYMLSKEGQGAELQTRHYVDVEWLAFDGTPACTKEDIFDLFSVHTAKINAAFDEMENVAGSVDTYIRDTLGVTDEMQRALKRHYLEPA